MANVLNTFRNTDLNAPPLTGQVGSGIAVLDAVLVNGYGATGISITGITRSVNTATATCSAADILRLQTGSYVTVSGAVQTDYNGTFQITVASTTTFTYTVANTPTTPATGTIVFALTLPITSITFVGTTATATLTQANSTIRTGEYFTFAGATGGDASLYNGSYKVTVNSSTSISYTMSGTPSGNATGTLVYSKTGLGWTKPFSGTNKAAYLPQVVTGFPRFYLRVVDNALTAGGAKEMSALGLETMSDVDTGTGKFPTTAQVALSGTEAVGGVCWRKSSAADTTTRAWAIEGTGYFFMFHPNSDAANTTGRNLNAFGGFFSFKTSDAYNCLISGIGAFNSATATATNGGLTGSLAINGGSTNTGLWLARSSSQTGGSLGAASTHFSPTSTTLGVTLSNGMIYPNSADGALWVMPLVIVESPAASPGYRGRVPGLFGPAHFTTLPINEFDTATNIVGLSGVTLTGFTIATSSGQGLALIDTTGPWA